MVHVFRVKTYQETSLSSECQTASIVTATEVILGFDCMSRVVMQYSCKTQLYDYKHFPLHVPSLPVITISTHGKSITDVK